MMNPEDIARMVEKANANAALMNGTDDMVMKIIAENDVVWGVWQDATQRDGVGLHLIKGRHPLKITPASSLPGIRVSAIPCAGYGDAVAKRRDIGDGKLAGVD
jgi:hypothetical protein